MCDVDTAAAMAELGKAELEEIGADEGGQCQPIGVLGVSKGGADQDDKAGKGHDDTIDIHGVVPPIGVGSNGLV